jgi:hypothetical protein
VLYVAGWTDWVVSTGCAERSRLLHGGGTSITVRSVGRELSACTVGVVLVWNVFVHWKWIVVLKKLWDS